MNLVCFPFNRRESSYNGIIKVCVNRYAQQEHTESLSESQKSFIDCEHLKFPSDLGQPMTPADLIELVWVF